MSADFRRSSSRFTNQVILLQLQPLTGDYKRSSYHRKRAQSADRNTKLGLSSHIRGQLAPAEATLQLHPAVPVAAWRSSGLL